MAKVLWDKTSRLVMTQGISATFHFLFSGLFHVMTTCMCPRMGQRHQNKRVERTWRCRWMMSVLSSDLIWCVMKKVGSVDVRIYENPAVMSKWCHMPGNGCVCLHGAPYISCFPSLLGFDRGKAARDMIRAFSHQIFSSGHVRTYTYSVVQ